MGMGNLRVEVSGRLEPYSLLWVREEKRELLLQANNYLVNTHIWDGPHTEAFDIQRYLQNYVANPATRTCARSTNLSRRRAVNSPLLAHEFPIELGAHLRLDGAALLKEPCHTVSLTGSKHLASPLMIHGTEIA
jgi:hypothetical protein